MVAQLPVVTDSLRLYLGEIRRFPLLSEEEEHRYAVALFENKDLAAAHSLITSNLRFVVKVAYEFRHYGLKMLDLIQEGNIGLMMAVKKYNPYKGIRLISYAVWWIRAYIQNHIISSWSLLKIGTTQAQRKLFFKLRQAKNAIARMGDNGDDTRSAALSLDVTEQQFSEMEQRMRGDSSLNAEIPGSDGITALETLADDRMNQEELLSNFQENKQLQQTVADVVSRLNEKERFIIEHRITADEPLTLQEIASHFSISRERVRQIEEGALRKTKQALLPLLAA
ncbi:MAG: RNA polymerase subunit sigma-70 [Geobacteraceae bacterium GWC2_55_20]|nr:MAG: RNA polymerase subunit sigma-70 [Geobacteraceae bacterium GWC2_55_20]HBA71067.1 RNA polymerase sigma factor RpoH [Geobacter sp.]HCE68266.1 RNA polymerase sigma factor RpoH [Geobacter sp.]